MSAWYTVHVYEYVYSGMLAIQSKSLQQRLMQHHTTLDKMD